MGLLLSLMVETLLAAPAETVELAVLSCTADDPSGPEATCQVMLAVDPPFEREVSDAELLWVVGGGPGKNAVADAVNPLIGAPWSPRAWEFPSPFGVRRDKDAEPRTIELTLIDAPALPVLRLAAPLSKKGAQAPTGPHVLRLRASGRAPIGGGWTLTVPRAWLAGSDAPGAIDPSRITLLGYRVDRLTAADFALEGGPESLPLGVLLRSIHPSTSGDLPPQLEIDDLTQLVERSRQSLTLDVVAGGESSPPLGDAAAFWLVCRLASNDAATAIIVALGRSTPGLGQRVAEEIARLATIDPFARALALTTLLPDGPELPDARLFIEAIGGMPAVTRARIASGLLAAPEGVLRRQVVNGAAPALLASVTELSVEQVLVLVDALAKLEAGSALSVAFGWRSQPIFDQLRTALGDAAFGELGAKMVARSVPDEVVEALVDERREVRGVARAILSGAGDAARTAVRTRLERLGLDVPAVGPEATAERLTSRLEGALLTPRIGKYVEQAQSLQVKNEPCTGVLEMARKEIHPDVVLPEPLYARCRALDATMLAFTKSAEEALVRFTEILRDAPDDRLVRERHTTVVGVRARELLAEGKLTQAEAVIERVPEAESTQLAGVRADVATAYGHEALAAGDEARARRFFVAARLQDRTRPTADSLIEAGRPGLAEGLIALLAIAICFGIAGAGYRRFVSAIVRHEFRRMVGSSRTDRFFGPRFRRLTLAPQGLLIERPLWARFIPFSSIEQVSLLSGSSDSGGILLKLNDGEHFVISTFRVDRFDLFLQALEPALAKAGRAMAAKATDDAGLEIASENILVMEDLGKWDRIGTWLRLGLMAFATVGAWFVAIWETGGGSWMARLGVGAGIAVGLLLAGVSLINALVPPARV
ncbi:MAG: hypothetical protein IV100_04320 [Myxococcales bacterium]|nr:hypothetical protein [Myxococcales bacterium]